jgi:HEAT repeat protein
MKGSIHKKTCIGIAVGFLAWFSLMPLLSAMQQSQADELVHELGEFPAVIRGTVNMGGSDPIEERRSRVYAELQKMGKPALPSLCRGLADLDVNVRRGVALFLDVNSIIWSRPEYGLTPLDISPCLQDLIGALQDQDPRVRVLSAQAIANVGSDAVAAVPALISR